MIETIEERLRHAATMDNVPGGLMEDAADEIRLLTLAKDDVAVLEEQFKVACARSEAWKALAMAVRKEYGKATELLGTASAYLFAFGTHHKNGQGMPERAYQEALDLDVLIQQTVKTAASTIPIPAILREELKP